MLHWNKAVCLGLTILLFTVGVQGTGLAATLEVGEGKDYTSIQDAVGSAGSGDTVIVYDGIYKESVIVDVENLTLKSHKQWRAILDGSDKPKTSQYAFMVTSSGCKIVGFHITNWNTDSATGTNYGIVWINKASSCEVKYNKFTNNVSDVSNCALVHFNRGKCVLRGNWFQNNTASKSIVTTQYSGNTIYELNNFLDENSGGYPIYHKQSGHNSVFRYNRFIHKTRLRQSRNLIVEHNIWVKGYLELHDQVGTRGSGCKANYQACANRAEFKCDGKSHDDYDSMGGCVEDKDENHIVRNNTFYGDEGVRQLDMPGQDGVKIENNLFVNANVYSIGAKYGAEGVGGLIISNNKRSGGAGKWIDPNITDKYIESGSSECTANFNTSSGSHSCNQSSYGADLKTDVWPFTKQNGSSLAPDYPYGSMESNASQEASLQVPSPPIDFEIHS